MNKKRYCVIMAGGIGSRFWPISRNSRPKQFLDILGTGKTFIRSTFERFLPVVAAENFLVVTNAIYKDMVLAQLPELGEEQVLCEPIGRNTAPAIAYAAFRLRAVDPDAEMIVTPSDHIIFNEREFVGAVERSLDFIGKHDALMTIGIKPTHPNTGYGYIQIEQGCNPDTEICRVRTFTEKPDLTMAKTFVESGEFFWNSGIFIWRADTILEVLRQALPDMYALFDSGGKCYNTAREREFVDGIYPECRAISIDFGVMEKAQNVYVCCGEFGWTDMGTWGSLYEYSARDTDGNAASGESMLYGTKDCVVKIPENKLAVIEGLEDYIIVDSGDVLMICPRKNEQNIKKYVEDIKFGKGSKYI